MRVLIYSCTPVEVTATEIFESLFTSSVSVCLRLAICRRRTHIGSLSALASASRLPQARADILPVCSDLWMTIGIEPAQAFLHYIPIRHVFVPFAKHAESESSP